MKTLLTYRGTVYPWHCDQMGHMNVMWYVGKFDEATWQLFGRIGITPTYLREGTHGMAGVQQNITYARELFSGSLIEIRSLLHGIRDKVIEFTHEMRDVEADCVAATCRLTAVHLDRRTHKATPFPKHVKDLALAMIGENPERNPDGE